jgi:hypothetical protein
MTTKKNSVTHREEQNGSDVALEETATPLDSRPHLDVAFERPKQTPKAAMLPNGRPIEPSHLRISDKCSHPGQPVFISELEISQVDTLPGHRPIFSSHLNAKMGQLPGNRPIASNDLGDSDLMGYI